MKGLRSIFHGYVLAAVLTSAAGAGVLIVDKGGSGDFTEIQPALDAAAGGDKVVVLPGEYVIAEPLNFNRLRDPDSPPGEGVKDILLESQTGPETTIIRMSDSPAGPERASLVMFVSGETNASAIQGFTLTGGRGTGTDEAWRGGAVCCESSSPILRDCIIRGNRSHRGGGIYCGEGCGAVIWSCTIADNVAPHGGGAFVGGSSSPTFRQCRIHGNETCGILAEGTEERPASSILVHSCEIFRNRADADYGGGGGISLRWAQGTITNCAIYKNEGWAAGYGGGLLVSDATAELNFCTVVGNRADGQAGGIMVDHGNLRMTSTILWGNGDNLLVPEYGPSTVEARSCLIGDEPGFEGNGNVDADPLFVDPAIADFEAEGGDYHLLAASPAIDAGTAIPGVLTDIDEDKRSCGARPDIGADENCTFQTLFRRGDGNGDGVVDISDGVFCLCWFFLGCWAPCHEACNSNDDTQINITDSIYVLNWLFLGGPQPMSPGPFTCGPDPEGSPSYAGCNSYTRC